MDTVFVANAIIEFCKTGFAQNLIWLILGLTIIFYFGEVIKCKIQDVISAKLKNWDFLFKGNTSQMIPAYSTKGASSFHAYWLASDIWQVIATLLLNGSNSDIAHALNTSSNHAKELALQEESEMLKQLKANVQAVLSLTPDIRNNMANTLYKLIIETGAKLDDIKN